MEDESKLNNIFAKNPKQYLMETDKGARDVFSGKFESGTQESLLMSPPKRREINRYVTLMDEYPEDKLDQYDMSVHDAINSIFNNGDDIMSIPMIIRTMSGNSRLKPSQKQEEKVLAIVKRLLSTGIDIVYDQEAEAYRFDDDGDGYHYYGTILCGEIITAKINGQIVKSCLHLQREPILSTLARKKKQIATIDMRMLNTPISMNEENIVLRNYLLLRIEQCRHNRHQELISNRTIKLDTVYKVLHFSHDDYVKKTRVRRKVIKLLEYWKCKKFIIGYMIEDEKIILDFIPMPAGGTV